MRLILVDDDLNIRQAVASLLRSHGHEVRAFESGEQCLAVPLEADCAIIDIALPVEVEFQELFAYHSGEAFEYEVQDDHVDLESLIRDAVVLSLPFQPVCRPDCPGLDPVTGLRLADHPELVTPEQRDPRWDVLAGFKASEDQGTGAAPEADQQRD